MNAQLEQNGHILTAGDLVIDCGNRNIQLASEVAEILKNPHVTITYQGVEL